MPVIPKYPEYELAIPEKEKSYDRPLFGMINEELAACDVRDYQEFLGTSYGAVTTLLNSGSDEFKSKFAGIMDLLKDNPTVLNSLYLWGFMHLAEEPIQDPGTPDTHPVEKVVTCILGILHRLHQKKIDNHKRGAFVYGIHKDEETRVLDLLSWITQSLDPELTRSNFTGHTVDGKVLRILDKNNNSYRYDMMKLRETFGIASYIDPPLKGDEIGHYEDAVGLNRLAEIVSNQSVATRARCVAALYSSSLRRAKLNPLFSAHALDTSAYGDTEKAIYKMKDKLIVPTLEEYDRLVELADMDCLWAVILLELIEGIPHKTVESQYASSGKIPPGYSKLADLIIMVYRNFGCEGIENYSGNPYLLAEQLVEGQDYEQTRKKVAIAEWHLKNTGDRKQISPDTLDDAEISNTIWRYRWLSDGPVKFCETAYPASKDLILCKSRHIDKIRERLKPGMSEDQIAALETFADHYKRDPGTTQVILRKDLVNKFRLALEHYLRSGEYIPINETSKILELVNKRFEDERELKKMRAFKTRIHYLRLPYRGSNFEDFKERYDKLFNPHPLVLWMLQYSTKGISGLATYWGKDMEGEEERGND